MDGRLVIRFRRAYVSAVNLSYPKTFLVHSVMRQIFGNTVGLNLALCLKELYVDPAKRRYHGHKKDAGPRSIYEQPLTCDLNGNISFSIDIFFIHFAKSHSP